MLQFFREKKFSYLLKAPSGRRGFFFSLRAGFEKPQDEQSGMTVSLPLVDQWLGEAVQRYASGEAEPDRLLEILREFLSTRAATDGARLVSVVLEEERNWAVGWDQNSEGDQFWFQTSHYEEVVNENAADLWRIDLVWTRAPEDRFDYFHESLRILKTLPPGLKRKPEVKLSPTCFLSEMRIQSRAQSWALEI